ncbi:MAG: hypothetical protein NC394_06240 [Bacteroides sp.]|nr:hypothetical protein [Bacteroides sp.]
MSKKSVIGAALAAVLLIVGIVLAVLLGGVSSLPDGAKQFRGIVNGCSKMSASAVQSNYGRSALYSPPSLVGCETIDDYMKSCGLKFNYMKEEGNVTERVYFVSASESSEVEDVFFGQGEFSIIGAVVGADYVNAEGEKKTAYKSFTVICSSKGGILSVD